MRMSILFTERTSARRVIQSLKYLETGNVVACLTSPQLLVPDNLRDIYRLREIVVPNFTLEWHTSQTANISKRYPQNLPKIFYFPKSSSEFPVNIFWTCMLFESLFYTKRINKNLIDSSICSKVCNVKNWKGMMHNEFSFDVFAEEKRS